MSQNLMALAETKDFFVYVDPDDFISAHNIRFTGQFSSSPTPDGQSLALDSHVVPMFVPNPDFKGFVSPFHNNLLRNFAVEYALEHFRSRLFPRYPSRLQALFVLPDEEQAQNYLNRHPNHVGNRILKRGSVSSPSLYSQHDSAWINFLRLGLMIDPKDYERFAKAYWSGERVCDYKPIAFGKPWTEEPVWEVLLYGRLVFNDRSLVRPE
jgi:hypothetical protein